MQRGAENRGGEEGVFIDVKKSSDAGRAARYPIRGALNPGGQIPQSRL